jgi:anti-sigma-K factor RskA
MHLKAGELVDLVEGTRPESSAPHLAACAACRQQLADARAMMALATDVAVPEPSPLFWDHLSDRVRQAVAAEPEPRRSWIPSLTWTRVLVPVASLAVVALVVLLVNLRTPASRATTPGATCSRNRRVPPTIRR